MAKVKVCDGCNKPIDKVVAKLFYSEIKEANGTRSHHSKYTMHADLGECCAPRFRAAIRWQKRQGRNGTGSSVAQKVA